MSLSTLIPDLIGSGVGGGILGVGGAIVQKYMDYKSLDKKQQFELAKTSLDNTHTEELAKLSLSEKDYEVLKTSMESDKATYSAELDGSGNKSQLLVVADFIRALVRPGLTTFLLLFNCGLLGYLVYKYNLQFTPTQAYEIANSILSCLLGCTTLALGWWFGARKTN